MTQTITLKVKDIIHTNGNKELIVVTPVQWAGKLRSKGYKKGLLAVKELAIINIKIKTK